MTRPARPLSIIWFERIAYLSLALSTIVTFIVYGELRASPPDPAHAGPGRVFAFLIVTLALYIPLILLAAHRASNLARWSLAALLAVSFVGLLSVPGILNYGGPSVPLALAQFPISAILLWLLFRRDARQWFAGKAEVDPNIFS
jgi:peptidoglycan/LPS O-acetylase OafA/YrhL